MGSADPDTPPATRTRIELASEARDFAIRELALPDSGSYEKYADLQRPYALWYVVATPEFSLKPLRWVFPIAGRGPYRGDFGELDARSMAWKNSRFMASDCLVCVGHIARNAIACVSRSSFLDSMRP